MYFMYGEPDHIQNASDDSEGILVDTSTYLGFLNGRVILQDMGIADFYDHGEWTRSYAYDTGKEYSPIPNEWIHVAVVYNENEEMFVYFNGEERTHYQLMTGRKASNRVFNLEHDAKYYFLGFPLVKR